MSRLIEALRPWLRQLVIVGGWAHQLHRFHSLANHEISYLPLRTRDADFAFSPTDRLVGNIRSALTEAGFLEDLSGDERPPVAQYRLGGDDKGFYAEFLVPLQGDGTNRDGSPATTLAQAGVTAQKLRYVDLLLTDPWTVRIDGTVGAPLSNSAEVMIANPVSFIVQKLLIQKYRKPEKRPQDVLYIHDTLELFAGELEALRSIWTTRLRPTLSPKTARQIERMSIQQFSVVTDVVRKAARIPQDRQLGPEQIRAACSYGLDEIFHKSIIGH
jgi:hypothetical protein